MKKAIITLLTGALLLCQGMTVHSATVTPDTSDWAEADVKYDVLPHYTVTIPKDVTLSQNDVTHNITVSDVVLDSGVSVIIKLTKAQNAVSGSQFTLAIPGNTGATATYQIKKGSTALQLNSEVVHFTYDGSENSFTQPVTFTAPQNARYASTYTDMLTSTVSTKGLGTVNLSRLTDDFTAQDGDVLTGTLSGNHKISIADGANITLNNVRIDGGYEFPGITCRGRAGITLINSNTVMSSEYNSAGIYVPKGKVLSISGNGSLNVRNMSFGSAGIGGEGNVSINGGNITAIGGDYAAGIGSGYESSFGNISINGGTVTATGGNYAAGIGSGSYGSCKNINISKGTVTATGGYSAAGIGSGSYGSCQNIMIGNLVTRVEATKGKGAPNSIGAGSDGTCGTVTIQDKNKVIQN